VGAAGTESSGVFSWKIITDGFLAEQDLEIRLKRSVFGTNGLTLNATIAPVLLATTCAALMAQPTHSDDVVEHPEGLKARCRSKLCLGPAVSLIALGRIRNFGG
jgi:hypothetical protein